MSRQEKLAALASTGVTKTELDNIDGGTARGTTAIADGDGVLINDAGTMRMTSVETMATYMGTKITGGSMVYLASSGAISNAASVSFTQFDSTAYDHYQFWFQNVIPVTDNVDLYLRTSTDGGSNYASSNGDYHFYGNTDKTAMVVTNGIGSDTNEYGVSGPFYLFAPHLTAYTYGDSTNITYINHQNYIYTTPPGAGSGNVRLAAEDVDAVQILFSSGNIESGEIVMYGIANGT